VRFVAAVATGNVAVVAPAATITFAGTVEYVVLELRNATLAPPLGAGALRVTFPLVAAPPMTLAFVNVTAVSASAVPGVTVNVVVFVVPA